MTPKADKSADKAVEEKPKKVEKQEADANEVEYKEEVTETGVKLAFPEAAIVRVMKKHLDNEKMIKKDVKVAMNKWLEKMCAIVSKQMNKFPYVMMNINEFKEGIQTFERLAEFELEKNRILAHMDAIKQDIGKLERDLGKVEEELVEA